jgi:hypothetical protein
MMTDLPPVGRPAQRALASAGYSSIEQLAGASRRELLALHGVGPRAVTLLDNELIKRGIEPLRDN